MSSNTPRVAARIAARIFPIETHVLRIAKGRTSPEEVGLYRLILNGGTSLPRAGGDRRRAEPFCTAQHAAFRETEATALAVTLATGPTRAYGAVRRMLRQSFEAVLSDQLEAGNGTP